MALARDLLLPDRLCRYPTLTHSLTPFVLLLPLLRAHLEGQDRRHVEVGRQVAAHRGPRFAPLHRAAALLTHFRPRAPATALPAAAATAGGAARDGHAAQSPGFGHEREHGVWLARDGRAVGALYDHDVLFFLSSTSSALLSIPQHRAASESRLPLAGGCDGKNAVNAQFTTAALEKGRMSKQGQSAPRRLKSGQDEGGRPRPWTGHHIARASFACGRSALSRTPRKFALSPSLCCRPFRSVAANWLIGKKEAKGAPRAAGRLRDSQTDRQTGRCTLTHSLTHSGDRVQICSS